MSINPYAFVENLRYMGEGMLCIIIVMGVIIAATALLNYVCGKKK